MPRKHYYTGYGSDDGYDAIRDANAEAGYGPRHSYGWGEAKRRGWLRKVEVEETEEVSPNPPRLDNNDD